MFLGGNVRRKCPGEMSGENLRGEMSGGIVLGNCPVEIFQGGKVRRWENSLLPLLHESRVFHMVTLFSKCYSRVFRMIPALITRDLRLSYITFPRFPHDSRAFHMIFPHFLQLSLLNRITVALL